MTDFVSRQDALRDELDAEDLDALLVTSLVNVRYLTGFTGTAGQLLVAKDPARDVFVTDDRYELQAGQQVEGLPTIVTRVDDWLAEAVAGTSRLGLEAHNVPWGRVNDLICTVTGDLASGHAPTVQATTGLVERLRVRKDDGEINAIARAAEVAGLALAALYDTVRPEWTERAAAIWLERTMVDLGAERPAFPTIVAAGQNGAEPHHGAGDDPLGASELITIDFGATVDGYNSDCTRVFSFGEPDADKRELFNVVEQAQKAGVAAVTDGLSGVDADETCRAVIRDAGFGEAFRHGTGHGIGLDVHEAPSLSPRSSSTLTDAMVVTVEPGVYLPGIGGARVEDTVAIQPGQAQVLTTTPTSLAVL